MSGFEVTQSDLSWAKCFLILMLIASVIAIGTLFGALRFGDMSGILFAVYVWGVTLSIFVGRNARKSFERGQPEWVSVYQPLLILNFLALSALVVAYGLVRMSGDDWGEVVVGTTVFGFVAFSGAKSGSALLRLSLAQRRDPENYGGPL